MEKGSKESLSSVQIVVDIHGGHILKKMVGIAWTMIKFSKTAIDYLKRIAWAEGEEFAKKVAMQCLIDTDYGYVKFIQVIKSSRKIRPL